MKITDVETIFIDEYLFVKVHTDQGITGLGESGAWAHLESSAAAVQKFKTYLIGQDPLRIEHHWQYLYRWTHFRGTAIMGALSAIDIALWDIAGKYFGVPVYQLLGGKTRDKVRTYLWIRGDTEEKLVQKCIDAKKKGFTAVGHLNPFFDVPHNIPYYDTYTGKIKKAVEAIKHCREAVGDDVDICVEIHTRLTPPEAIELARGIAEFRPYFYEDPIYPDNIDVMGYVAQNIQIPIATGERLHNIYEFAMLLNRKAAQYLRTCVCACGGLTASKKIAAMAEANYVGIVPHNPLSPVSTAACVQLAACIPNLALQEYSGGEGIAPKSEIVKQPLKVEGGYIIVPDAPGIGIELADDAQERYPYRPLVIDTRLNLDGSVIDQ
ncbi:MAG: galactonate dehydratase [Deltaproteobacteria bacterium]|nr:galactonate dehydratase [Deltaproteobacteria bacterium]